MTSKTDSSKHKLNNTRIRKRREGVDKQKNIRFIPRHEAYLHRQALVRIESRRTFIAVKPDLPITICTLQSPGTVTPRIPRQLLQKRSQLILFLSSTQTRYPFLGEKAFTVLIQNLNSIPFSVVSQCSKQVKLS